MKEKMWIAAVSLALLLTGGAFSAAAENRHCILRVGRV